MKKSVILTIAVIYIFAIVIVGFMGMKMNVYNEKVYVNEIVVLSQDYKPYTDDTELGKNMLEDGYSGYITRSDFTYGMKIEIKCDVKPDNADNKKLIYSCAESSKYKLILNSDGTATIEFYEGTVVDLIIKSSDTVGESIKIRIIVNDFSDL